jgi:uncharacterized protein YqjF (DUF2071 family)
MSDFAGLLELRRRPEGKPIMLQTWANLTFLHWDFEPGLIEPLLPESLTIDTFEGRAYVGLVPFYMRAIRHRSGLRIPTAHNFLETNVRTYVIGPDGTPGVWFFSLDASSRLAAIGGRKLYGLPYHHSIMLAFEQERLRYDLIRKDGTDSTVFTSVPQSFASAEPGSREFWLVERYQLFSEHRGRIKSGRVWHEPYQISACDSLCESYGPLKAAGIDPKGRNPLVHFSPGVNVEVWPLVKVQ